MKKYNLIFGFFVMSILMLSFVSSYMPDTHKYIADQSILQASNSEYGKIAQKYPDDFVGCNILVDISVLAYFSEGFNKISTKYKATHSTSMCQRAVQNAETERELACAIGICAHHTTDGVAHNEFVVEVIERTNLVNGLIHIFAEEKVNDALLKLEGRELSVQTRQALANVAPVHKEFFRELLVTEGTSFNFDAMFDAFTNEVTGNDKYSVGFRGFTAIPTSIHIVMFLIFALMLTLLAFLYKREKKTIINYIGMTIAFLIALTVILAYVLFFTGKIWMFFQTVSYPVSQMMPTSGWEVHLNKAVQETTNMLKGGSNYVMAVTPDPAGEHALTNASAVGSGVRTVVNVIIVIIIGIFVWLNFKKKKK